MTPQQYPQYDPADVKKWLTQVFGKDILFESQASRRWAGRDSKVDPSAWQLYYTGEIFLQMDLPPLLTPYFVSSLRAHLERGIKNQIDPNSFRTNRQERTKQLRDSDWPFPADVIREGLSIDTDKLRIVAERLSKPAEGVAGTIREMLAQEAAWIERKQSVASICNELFLGQPESAPSFGFHYGTTSGNRSGLELALVISDYSPPFSGDAYQEQNKWRERNRELGLKGMLAYEDFHIGTHAPIDEFKFSLYGISDMEIANKLEELRKPEKLAVVRQYINEVISATSIQNWLPHNEHPDRANDLGNVWALMPDNLSEEEQVDWRKSQRSAMEATSKYSVWKEVFPQLAQDHPTTGEFVQAVYREPPIGQEEIYTRLRSWTDKTFPLLKGYLDTAAPITPARRLGAVGEIPPAPGG